MKGGNFFTKSIAKIMNNYQNCNDLHQKLSQYKQPLTQKGAD